MKINTFKIPSFSLSLLNGLRKRSLLLGLSGLSLLNSCTKKQKDEEQIVPSTVVAHVEEIHLCTEKDLSKDSVRNLRVEAALYSSSKWTPGQTIRIKFLNGDDFLKQKVIDYARVWYAFANLTFQYVGPNEAADIKIAFQWNGDGGSWSTLGKQCQSISQTSPSMNFGWFNSSTSDTEFRRTILHEFGHALGLIHEHQSPVANIPWNKPAVYAYYAAAPNYWTAATVDANIFAKYSTTQTNYTNYDRSSIMQYAVPSSLTTDGSSIGLNTYLSYTDIAFIKQQYQYNNPVEADKLYAGQSLYQNQFIKSPDGRFKLKMQTDGNLVLYKNETIPLWNSHTQGNPGITHLDLQGDGNLVLYNDTYVPYWNSVTQYYPKSVLVLQNDGNLVLYYNNVPVWNTHTQGS